VAGRQADADSGDGVEAGGAGGRWCRAVDSGVIQSAGGGVSVGQKLFKVVR
jgi:hypothetical protein